MKLKDDVEYDVGVMVARFQVPELHAAHKDLIETVCKAHDKVLIFLGLSEAKVTRENPLDYQARRQMIQAEFPDVEVFYVPDRPSDNVWSEHLDQQIAHHVTPSQSAVLYGGRDSFIEHYVGKYPVRELIQDVWMSGTEMRKAIARKSTKASPEFRAGVVWAAYGRFPTCYPTVDVAVFNEQEDSILLGRKADETLYRLIGGFADPKSPSFEADARREVKEEAGISITDPVYVGSFSIDDWRYRNEVDKIKTLLFRAKLMAGRPKPDDDIAEVRWFHTVDLNPLDVVENHRRLVAAAMQSTGALVASDWEPHLS